MSEHEAENGNGIETRNMGLIIKEVLEEHRMYSKLACYCGWTMPPNYVMIKKNTSLHSELAEHLATEIEHALVEAGFRQED